jgi:hypothetical protein
MYESLYFRKSFGICKTNWRHYGFQTIYDTDLCGMELLALRSFFSVCVAANTLGQLVLLYIHNSSFISFCLLALCAEKEEFLLLCLL